MAAGFSIVVGDSALSASLASHTDVVSVTALGGNPPMTGSFNTGHHAGQEASGGTPYVLTASLPDTRTYRVVFNA